MTILYQIFMTRHCMNFYLSVNVVQLIRELIDMWRQWYSTTCCSLWISLHYLSITLTRRVLDYDSVVWDSCNMFDMERYEKCSSKCCKDSYWVTHLSIYTETDWEPLVSLYRRNIIESLNYICGQKEDVSHFCVCARIM